MNWDSCIYGVLIDIFSSSRNLMAVSSLGWSGMWSYAVLVGLFSVLFCFVLICIFFVCLFFPHCLKTTENCMIPFHFGDSRGMCSPIKIRPRNIILKMCPLEDEDDNMDEVGATFTREILFDSLTTAAY